MSYYGEDPRSKPEDLFSLFVSFSSHLQVSSFHCHSLDDILTIRVGLQRAESEIIASEKKVQGKQEKKLPDVGSRVAPVVAPVDDKASLGVSRSTLVIILCASLTRSSATGIIWKSGTAIDRKRGIRRDDARFAIRSWTS